MQQARSGQLQELSLWPLAANQGAVRCLRLMPHYGWLSGGLRIGWAAGCQDLWQPMQSIAHM